MKLRLSLIFDYEAFVNQALAKYAGHYMQYLKLPKKVKRKEGKLVNFLIHFIGKISLFYLWIVLSLYHFFLPKEKV